MGFFDNINWQEREEYATGVRVEAGPGYNIGIDDPIVKAVVTAGESGAVVNMVRELPDGKYMISMDIGGTAVANKDIITFSDGSATCGDYTLTYSDYALTITTVEEDTVVHIIMWKVAVNITNEFRAAIKDVVGDIGGGSSGGGALIVTEFNGTLDKTFGEIRAAMETTPGNNIPVFIFDNYLSAPKMKPVVYMTTSSFGGGTIYALVAQSGVGVSLVSYDANSDNAYPEVPIGGDN